MILCVTLGKTPGEIGAMPARDVQRLRKFYRWHPFGPLRGDLQAWLSGSQARTGFGGKPIKLEQAIKMFDGFMLTRKERNRKERRERRRIPKAKVTGAKLKSLCQLMGGEVRDGGN